MKIVICGAGLFGSAIARHLSAEQNDVTVIDIDPDKLQRLTEQADVGAVEGMSSYPDILAQAGLKDAELLIAVTESDEINMVACQVAHTIFETPTRIARIRSRARRGIVCVSRALTPETTKSEEVKISSSFFFSSREKKRRFERSE